MIFADSRIVLSTIVRDERDGCIQESLPTERKMAPCHFLEVRVEGSKTGAFKTLRSQILAIVGGEIRGFGSAK